MGYVTRSGMREDTKVLTVKKLKEILSDIPDGMEIIYDRCSDYDHMYPDDISVVEGVCNESGGWIMRSHPTMSDENKKKSKSYLHFPGN